jgi:transposase
MTPWLVHELRNLGLEVVCLDARHARAALKMQINKTDQNDAEGLAQIVRTGWYRSVHVKSFESHRLRALLGKTQERRITSSATDDRQRCDFSGLTGAISGAQIRAPPASSCRTIRPIMSSSICKAG